MRGGLVNEGRRVAAGQCASYSRDGRRLVAAGPLVGPSLPAHATGCPSERRHLGPPFRWADRDKCARKGGPMKKKPDGYREIFCRFITLKKREKDIPEKRQGISLLRESVV